MNILIVEDDTMFSQFYCMYAEVQGDQYMAVNSLVDARMVLSSPETRFDAILLDNHLLDGQGLNLLPDISQLLPEAAVIMVSANDDPEFFLTAFNQGVDDYAVKPVNMDLLWVKLRRSVLQRQLRAANIRQQQELELWVNSEQREQSLANHILSSMTHLLTPNEPFIQSVVKPLAVFSGDVLLRQRAQDGSWYFLLADSMGHGLAAAVSLFPLLDVFQAMSKKGLPLSNIVFELNHKLSRQLPDDRFVAAVLIRVETVSDRIEIWNGGMPPILLHPYRDGPVVQVRSANMALGILDDRTVEVKTMQFPLKDYRKIIAISDGVTESTNSSQATLSMADIAEITGRDQGFEQLISQIEGFVDVSDDITACCIDLGLLGNEDFDLSFVDLTSESAIETRLLLKGQALQSCDVCQWLNQVLNDIGVPHEMVNKAMMIVTELFLNSFEHGVLALDSTLKQQEDGFFAYYEEKNIRSKGLTLLDYVEIRLSWHHQAKEIVVSVADSGAGFLVPESATGQEGDHHGRGLQLVASLADAMQFNATGNQVQVVING